MPIPDSTCPPGTTPDVCCDTLFLIGDRIRTVAFEALLGCFDTTCGDREFRSYTTFGSRIQDVLGESLIVTMVNSTNAPPTSSRRQHNLFASVTQANYRLELRENGYPQSKVNSAQVIEVPDYTRFNAAAAHTMGHAERMWTALTTAAADRTAHGRMFPLPLNHHVLQGGVGVGNLNPIGPEGYQAAWSVDVTVDVMLGMRHSFIAS